MLIESVLSLPMGGLEPEGEGEDNFFEAMDFMARCLAYDEEKRKESDDESGSRPSIQQANFPCVLAVDMHDGVRELVLEKDRFDE